MPTERIWLCHATIPVLETTFAKYLNLEVKGR